MNVAGTVFPCTLGRGGISAFKHEGDGATPLGTHCLLYGYFRQGRFGTRLTRLEMSVIDKEMGWCDAPADRNYNRPVRLPYAASHEIMLRGDELYDICIVLDWNMRQRRRGRGSAIFLHVAKPGLPPTEGCVAVRPPVLRRLLPYLSRHARLIVLR